MDEKQTFNNLQMENEIHANLGDENKFQPKKKVSCISKVKSR